MELNKAYKLQKQVKGLKSFQELKKATEDQYNKGENLHIMFNSDSVIIDEEFSTMIMGVLNSYARKQIELISNHIKNNY